MEKELDLRIQKTYMALTDAFLKLLESKRFEDITVGELCALAMVRRATFYKHFGDKYEFFAFMIREIQRKFNERGAQQVSLSASADFYVFVIRNTIDFLDENSALVRSVMKSNMFPILLDILSEQIVFDVQEHFRNDKENGIELPLPPELMAQAFTGVLVNIGKLWAVGKVRISKDDMIKRLSALAAKLYG